MNKLNRLKQIQKHNDLISVIKAINRYRYYNIFSLDSFLTELFYNPNKPERSILNEDWDICIILDACRYDLYKELHPITPYEYSLGSATNTWLKNTFTEYQSDLVYVTANPMVHKVDLADKFHAVIDVWDTDWNTKYKTVIPSDMTNAIINANDKYPHKKLLCHYVQPHYPFLTSNIDNQRGLTRLKYIANYNLYLENRHKDIWKIYRDTDLSFDQLWKWYRKNLELALKEIPKLTKHVRGKYLVTSDHGNMIGEKAYPFSKRYYGHPSSVKHISLRKVPWYTFNNGNRIILNEKINKELKQIDNINHENVNRKLRILGYV